MGEGGGTQAATSAKGHRPRGGSRPAIADWGFAAVALVVLLLALGSIAKVPALVTDVRTLHQAQDAGDQGRYKQAAIGFTEVVERHPASKNALVGLACSLAELGYRDHSLLVYGGLLEAGFEQASERPGLCFVFNPDGSGIENAVIGPDTVPFVSSGKDLDVRLVGLLQRASPSQGSYSDSFLLVACLNHRADLKLNAASNLTAAERAFAFYGAARGPGSHLVPDSCLKSFGEYRLTETPNGPVATARDADGRLFDPEHPQAAPRESSP